MTKKDGIKRLQELGVTLGRKVDVSGSLEDIIQRVKELEEEVGVTSGIEQDPGVNGSDEVVIIPGEQNIPVSSMVLIRARRTLHIDALSADSDRPVEVVKEGEMARISVGLLDELTDAGLVERV
ncbi:DNA breaking-rejoining protein [Salmonella enterica]|nr:DNA breaking-rejoining protein [Salmonella enterica]